MFVEPQRKEEPSRWANECAGVIEHQGKIVEVYHVEMEEKVRVADHVKNLDETIVPGYLKKQEKGS